RAARVTACQFKWNGAWPHNPAINGRRSALRGGGTLSLLRADNQTSTTHPPLRGTPNRKASGSPNRGAPRLGGPFGDPQCGFKTPSSVKCQLVRYVQRRKA